jgi:hypothetical protein
MWNAPRDHRAQDIERRSKVADGFMDTGPVPVLADRWIPGTSPGMTLGAELPSLPHPRPLPASPRA